MEFINRMRKDKKGFTLVEIIVVLVILAILAAFMIPTMLGFVGDSKGKAYLAEAREVYTAAQATATEATAKGDTDDSKLSTALSSPVISGYTETTAAAVVSTDTTEIKASKQMFKYIGTEFGTVSTATTMPASKVTTNPERPAWSVTVGTGVMAAADAAKATTTGKVNSIVYVRDNYQVTISNGNASVTQLK